jgi:hypothetical protein
MKWIRIVIPQAAYAVWSERKLMWPLSNIELHNAGLSLSANVHSPIVFLLRIKHVIDILTCESDCVINFLLPDRVSVLICETLHTPYHWRWKFYKKVVLAWLCATEFHMALQIYSSLLLRLQKHVGTGWGSSHSFLVLIRLSSFPALFLLSAFKFIHK